MEIKKIRGKERWEIPYSFAGRTSAAHISKEKDGTYFVYVGARSQIKNTFTEAVECAKNMILTA